MHRQSPIPFPILVHLSSHPTKEYVTYFTYIYFTCIVVDTIEYDNNISFRQYDPIVLVSMTIE